MKNSILALALNFLNELGQNNHKAWFDGHRRDYETARNEFYEFLKDLIAVVRESDHLLGNLMVKECVARIYRDVRFTKDKSPYKANLGAIVAPGGWKGAGNGYYISIEPSGLSIVAGGLHAPTSGQLNRFRAAILDDATAFKEISSERDFSKVFGGIEGVRLKTTPKGYDPAHPEIDLLCLK